MDNDSSLLVRRSCFLLLHVVLSSPVSCSTIGVVYRAAGYLPFFGDTVREMVIKTLSEKVSFDEARWAVISEVGRVTTAREAERPLRCVIRYSCMVRSMQRVICRRVMM